MGGWVKKLTHYDRGGREVGSDSLASFVQHGVKLPLAPTSDRPRQPMLNRGPGDIILQCIIYIVYIVYLRIILLKCFAVSNRSIKADCETSPVDVLNDKLSCESGGSIHHQVVATHPCHRLH